MLVVGAWADEDRISVDDWTTTSSIARSILPPSAETSQITVLRDYWIAEGFRPGGLAC